MPNLLLEILSEEIPARMQVPAQNQLRSYLTKALEEVGFKGINIETFSTPRRLVANICDVPKRTPDRILSKKGPRVSAPPKALEGFLKSVGLSSVEECQKIEDNKGDYYLYEKEVKGEDSRDVLTDILNKMFTSFSWPKSMRLAHMKGASWVRPLTSILTLFDCEILPVSYGNLSASNVTQGHRLLGKGPFVVKDWEDYKRILKDNFVILSREERCHIIKEQMHAVCVTHNLELIDDEPLLEEVIGLVEWPHMILGQVSEEFLELPPEAIRLTMRHHQKYLSLTDRQTGELAPYFMTAANIPPRGKGEEIATGNARVLTARLSDARHFIDTDRKKKLEDYVELLEKKIFHEQIGTLKDKALRIADIARKIAPALNVDPNEASEAACLAKADLVTHIVEEFAQLQGQMGGYYYRLQEGSYAAIAQAIEQHYRPQGPSDPLPDSALACTVAMADKIDNLVSFFSIGLKPTGSKDPYALRRAGLGLIRILLEKEISLDLGPFFGNKREELVTFLHERLKIVLKQENIPHDVIEAVLGHRLSIKKIDANIYALSGHICKLSQFLESKDGVQLKETFKRSHNILKSQKNVKTTPSEEHSISELKKSLNKNQGSESFHKLFDAVHNANQFLMTKEADHLEQRLENLIPLITPVRDFFDNTLILNEDSEVRQLNLALVRYLHSTFLTVVDFSQLEG